MFINAVNTFSKLIFTAKTRPRRISHQKVLNIIMTFTFGLTALLMPQSALAQSVNANAITHATYQHQLANEATLVQSASQTHITNDLNAILHNVVNNSLDLSSIIHDISAYSITGFHNVSITQGGLHDIITNNAVLTPAETVAVMQVLNHNSQNLILNTNGQAIGGYFNLSTANSNLGGSVLIPNNVTAIDKANSLSINGDLANYGNIYIIGNEKSALIETAGIYNAQSGLITSNNLNLNLGSATGFVHDTNVNLLSNSNFINQGNISSSGNLNIQAQGDMINSNIVTNTTNANLTANNNLSLATGSGYLYNDGIINAITGNTNISSSTDLNLTNINGTIEANNGSIYINDSNLNNINNINK